MRTGPADVVRVALVDFRWPLDPALAAGRDETTLARALYSTPLRTDPATGAVAPGLCTAWTASADFKRWSFTCRSAPSIAAALRRVVRLRDAPSRWLFADATISAATATSLIVRLPYSWRRFPYALTTVAAAPRFVPGPFELVSGARRLVVLRREGVTVEFRRLPARAAVREFRAGRLDEAPIPTGEVAATRADEGLGSAVRTQQLLGLDVVMLGERVSEPLRRAYRDSLNRRDYEGLVPERRNTSAYGFLGDEKAKPAEFRRAVESIRSLPRRVVTIDVPPDPALRAGARLLYAQWRDVALGPRLVSETRAEPDATLRRIVALYPQQEAIPAELVLRYALERRDGLVVALAATRQHGALRRVTDGLWTSARAVPVAWVVDARLVSQRLVGWREDLLGDVDYAAVRSLASSPRPSP